MFKIAIRFGVEPQTSNAAGNSPDANGTRGGRSSRNNRQPGGPRNHRLPLIEFAKPLSSERLRQRHMERIPRSAEVGGRVLTGQPFRMGKDRRPRRAATAKTPAAMSRSKSAGICACSAALIS